MGPLPGVVIDMAQHVQRVFAAARTALADADIDAARDVRQSDQRVDDLQREVFNWVQAKIPDDVDATQSAIDRLSAARKLERIADVSTNIAEDIIFLADVSLVRHADA